MPAPVKVFLGGAVVAGLGGTGVWLLYRPGSPDCRTLDQDSAFAGTSNPYQGKYAKDYARFLVGVGDDQENIKPNSNRDWWEWSFKNRYKKEEAKAGFKDVAKATKGSTPDSKSLQEKCEAAYKETAANVTNSATDADTTKYKEDQLWLYCGASSTKPKLLKDMTGSEDQDKKNMDAGGVWNNKLGSNKKNDLLAIYAPANKEAWDHLDRRFEKEKTTAGTGFFGNTGNGSTIKDRCAKAYGEATVSTNDDAKPKEADLYKWCSLKGSSGS